MSKKPYEKITVNNEWEYMILGLSDSERATIDIDASQAKYEKMAEEWLRERHDRIDDTTKIEFTDFPGWYRYKFGIDEDLDDEALSILLDLYNQGLWVVKKDNK